MASKKTKTEACHSTVVAKINNYFYGKEDYSASALAHTERALNNADDYEFFL